MNESNPASILSPEQIAPAVEAARKTLEQLDGALLGRQALHRLVLTGILSRGHILLEGLPGLGKTALIHALGKVLGLEFKRVQFTPDLMPGDIVGTSILQQRDDGQHAMHFEPGPVFTNILLADEINRASPKTQSALLEAMQEGSVTTLGETRRLPEPFFVLASQNPIELEGTYPLPEAQLDRFLFKLNVSGLDASTLEQIITTRRRGQPNPLTWSMTRDQLNGLFDVMSKIVLPAPVARYIARLVAATHPGSEEAVDAVNDYVVYGASPRAAIAIAEASRGYALIQGRPSVGFEDIKAVASSALNHRLILNYQARFDKLDQQAVVARLIESIDEADLRLPKGATVSG